MIKKKISDLLVIPMIRYMINSIFVSIIDVFIVWLLYRGIHINLVTANSVGVITGFIIHYSISSKSVFQTKLGPSGFAVYFGTFLLGLALADWLIFTGERYFFLNINKNLSFLLNKGISVLLPFFILYYLRRYLFNMLNTKVTNSKEQHG